MKKQTLKVEIYELLMDNHDNSEWVIAEKIMKAINNRALKIDVGEMIKMLFWESEQSPHKTLTYGDISTFVEKQIVKEMK